MYRDYQAQRLFDLSVRIVPLKFQLACGRRAKQPLARTAIFTKNIINMMLSLNFAAAL
jgi:hypothetical protein